MNAFKFLTNFHKKLKPFCRNQYETWFYIKSFADITYKEKHLKPSVNTGLSIVSIVGDKVDTRGFLGNN